MGWSDVWKYNRPALLHLLNVDRAISGIVDCVVQLDILTLEIIPKVFIQKNQVDLLGARAVYIALFVPSEITINHSAELPHVYTKEGLTH